MKFAKTIINGVYVISMEPHFDERGWFGRTFCADEFKEVVGAITFVQLNQSFNEKRGTFRGMHYQVPPFAEKKLIRCVSGGVLDIVVDIRRGSPTFLQSFAVELTAENRDMIFIPEGIAHGFITLDDRTSLLYHHTAFHHPDAARGIRYDDPLMKIKLPLAIEVMSGRDRSYENLPANFTGI